MNAILACAASTSGCGLKVQSSMLNTHAIDTQIYQYTSITLNHFNMFSSYFLSLEPWPCNLILINHISFISLSHKKWTGAKTLVLDLCLKYDKKL